MRKVTLTGTDLKASMLGFGCNALLGDQSRTEGLALLETAFDAGINYFDVARVYGYGEAERLVGEFARGRRSDVIIASKFGIQPMLPAAGAGFIRPLVLRLMRLSPRLRDLLGRRARAAVKHSRFSVEESRASLETSLRVLATDCIDVYLLHECTIADASDELLEFLSQARRAGKIRYFGIGTAFEHVVDFCRQRQEFAAVVQFQNSALTQNVENLTTAPGAVLTHGALGGSFSALTRYLTSDEEAAKRWSSALQADAGDPWVMTSLMLGYATQANQRGPVLFHSRRRDTIVSNVRAVERGIDREQIDTFARLAKASGVVPG